MPIYEFVGDCGHHFDHKMSVAAISGKTFVLPCPKCGRFVDAKRVWSPPNIQIKKVRGHE